MKMLLAVLAMAVAAISLDAVPAGAATPATTYADGGVTGCVRIAGYYSQINYHLPTAVADYVGTSDLYFAAEVYALDPRTDGLTYIETVNATYARTWVHVGTQLKAIYWGSRLPGSGAAIYLPPYGNITYVIFGHTEWFTGKRWALTSTTDLGGVTC